MLSLQRVNFLTHYYYEVRKIVFAVALIFTLCSAFTMKGGHKPVYAFGVAAAFNDSVVYYTEIQQLDSVSLDKNNFCLNVKCTVIS